MSEADFNVKLTVRNARLLRAVREQYGTAAQLSRAIGRNQPQVSALMTMRETPILADGEWRPIALDIAGALGMDPAELWPMHMRERTMKRATAEVELSAEQVAAFIAPAEDPADVIERRDTVAKLMTCLNDRDRDVVEQRMHGATYEDIAQEQGVTRERIRQCELRAHRNMRKKAQALTLWSRTA